MERIEDVFGRIDLLTGNEAKQALQVIYAALWIRKPTLDTLRVCHDQGPQFDGDVLSKKDRDDLIECGAIIKVVVKGEGGFNACTHFGKDLLRVGQIVHGCLEENK